MRASRLTFTGVRRAAFARLAQPPPPLGVCAAAAAAAAMMTTTSMGPLQTQARWASSKNPYAVLGIKQGADKTAIKKAYRVLARKHHPDAPGGNEEKFREVQEAYEQVKSGVWIRKDTGGSGGANGESGGGNANRYSGFRYTTRTHHKSKVSYDQFYEEMHTGKVRKDPFADDDDAATRDPAAKDPRRNPFAMNEVAFQAWLRFIIMWCVLFCTLRVGLFLLFPPKWEKPQRKPPPRELRTRRPPPPKPLGRPEEALIA